MVAEIDMGFAVFIIGLLAMMLGVGTVLRSPTAVFVWVITGIVIVLNLMGEVGDEVLWVVLMLAVLAFGFITVWRWFFD